MDQQSNSNKDKPSSLAMTAAKYQTPSNAPVRRPPTPESLEAMGFKRHAPSASGYILPTGKRFT
jgi:hypothetical protein